MAARWSNTPDSNPDMNPDRSYTSTVVAVAATVMETVPGATMCTETAGIPCSHEEAE